MTNKIINFHMKMEELLFFYRYVYEILKNLTFVGDGN